MSILKDIINNEKERLIELIELYNKELQELPRGSISIKKINKKKYVYLLYREKDKVKTDYIGAPDSDQVKDLEEKLKKEKKIEKLKKEAEKNLKEIMKYK